MLVLWWSGGGGQNLGPAKQMGDLIQAAVVMLGAGCVLYGFGYAVGHLATLFRVVAEI